MTRGKRSKAAVRELLLLAMGTLAVAALCVHFELSERILALTRPHERFQADEIPAVLLFVACGLAWYAWRRVREARRELALRQRVEARLRDALAENRNLALAAVRLQEEERRNIARELHDELGQHLLAARIDASALGDPACRDTPAAAAQVAVSLEHIEKIVRELVRRLRPAGLDDLGLPAALEEYADAWRRRHPAVALTLTVDAALETLDEVTNITLYRLIQEALTNVAKHAQAALVEVSLARDSQAPTRIVATVRDDGRGCDPARRSAGLGLIGMRERVEALAGRLHIDSADGRGFTVAASIPFAPAGSR